MQTADSVPHLVFMDSNGRQQLALSGDKVTIGRLPDQDVILDERYVSRRHATLERAGDQFEIIDQSSSHGTWVNGVRSQRVALKDGDILQFGSPASLRIRFQLGTTYPGAQPEGNADLLSTVLRISNPRRESGPARQLEQLSFLLEAARQLNAGQGSEEILKALLQLSMQLIGVDRSFVFLRRNGEMHFELGLQADGTVVHEDATVSRRAIQRAIESKQIFLVSDTISDAEAGAWNSVQQNSIRCIYCIPLRKRAPGGGPERLLGLLYLDSQVALRDMSPIDHKLLDTIASEASILLENALLAQAEKEAAHAAEELAIAARIHASLMATALPNVPFAQLRAQSVPCKAIGGDFYCAVELDNCLAVAIADVSGKGVPASIVAATMQGIIHAQLQAGQELGEIADQLNRFLCSRGTGKYATLVLLKLYSDGRLEYINCGHVKPLLVTEGKISNLDESNLIVGLIPGVTYREAVCALRPGSRIILATDGVTEAENSCQDQFGEERLERAVLTDRLEGVLQQVNQFQAGHPAQDDCTLLEIEYLPTR